MSSLQQENQLRSTLNTNVITGLDMCQVCNEKNQLRSTLNTNVITGLDMCQVCNEKNQLRSTLNTNVVTGLDRCVKSATRKSVAQHFEHERYHRFGHVSSLQRKKSVA